MQIGYVFSRAAETASRVSLGDGKKNARIPGRLCCCQLIIARVALGLAPGRRVFHKI